MGDFVRSEHHYDVVVIGSGGGTKISTPSAKAGKNVAIFERGFDVNLPDYPHRVGLGGTCLNRGCIPSKMLIYPAEVAETVRTASKYWIKNDPSFTIDRAALVDDTSSTVDSNSESIAPFYERLPTLTWYKNSTRFVGPRRLTAVTDDGKDIEITADKVFIACGSRPQVPPIPGLEGTPFLTSTEALRLRENPKSIIVIGGGYIATELAFYLGATGTPMTMLVRSQLLRTVDSEVRDHFGDIFRERFNVKEGMKFDKVEYDAEKKEFSVFYTLNVDGVQHVERAEHLLIATGVTPNSDTLDLEKAGIKTKRGGYIEVDEYLRTTAEGVWALGDVAGNYLFRHSVNHEGVYLMHHVINRNNPTEMPIDYSPMPWAIFTHPQVAGVGESEDQLKARGAKYVKGVNKYSQTAYGDAMRAKTGFAKMMVDPDTREILGFLIVGHEASILIHQVVQVMSMGGKLDDILKMIHIHPALSELIRNVARRTRNALVDGGHKVPDLVALL